MSNEAIEEFGMAEFNQPSQSVWTYEAAWREMTERMAYWVDSTATSPLHNDYGIGWCAKQVRQRTALPWPQGPPLLSTNGYILLQPRSSPWLQRSRGTIGLCEIQIERRRRLHPRLDDHAVDATRKRRFGGWPRCCLRSLPNQGSRR